MKAKIPNILTGGRFALSLATFAALVILSNAMVNPGLYPPPHLIAAFALGAFVVAAVTDFFDGWLARRWGVVSTFGAIMDPIADKILVCGAILGLIGVLIPGVLIPGAVILFREFAVSAMREVLAAKGLKLPVTFLAKIKTTLQLAALSALLAWLTWAMWPATSNPETMSKLLFGAQFLWVVAAGVTLWTGFEYAGAARKALREGQ